MFGAGLMPWLSSLKSSSPDLTPRPSERARTVIGTSSWTDPTLLKSKAFYPPDANKPEARLRFYAEHFPLVEVDATFYALPSERNARLWAERTPDHFVFNVKAFGLMTQHAVNTKSLPEPIRF